MFFFWRRKTAPERKKKEKEGDELHKKLIRQINKLDKELENEVSFRIYVGMGGDRRSKK